MRVQAISVPSVARSAEFGSAGMFVAGGREVTASTLRHDPMSGYAESGQVAVWVAVPVARDVLLAAWMLDGLGGVDRASLDEMSDDDVREHAINSLMMNGTVAAQNEIASAAFRAGYRTEGREVAGYFVVVAARLDRAFYGTAGADGTVPAPRPTCDPRPSTGRRALVRA